MTNNDELWMKLEASESDELALKLKAVAEMAMDAWKEFLSLPDDVELERGMSLDEMTLISSHNAASNPANILALLAERDADKKRIAEQDARLIEYARIATENAHRIAELEARTVSVKLPEPHAHLIWIQAGHGPDDYWDDVAVSHSVKDRCCDGSERYPVYSIFEIQEACAAAGIKLEVGE